MTELDDHDLLAEYARTGSEAAFAALVARHVYLVHSAARRFTGNPHHAEEITQAVFVILARKASSLRRRTVLSGWLYQTARLTAANFVKGEIRRQNREQEAFMQSTLTEPETAAWQQIAPLLDDAMGRLGEADRNAVVLRYFENKSAQEVATKLNVTEAAAHKRVNRAVEKLRKLFSKRGVTLTAALLAGAMAANSVQAAPAGLASVAAATAAQSTALSATLSTLIDATMKTMTWMNLKFAIGVGVALLLAGGAATVAISQTGGGKLTAQEIATQSQEMYAALTSYGDTGRVRIEIAGEKKQSTFSIRLQRPNHYHIEWTNSIESAPRLASSGVVWSEGKGDFSAIELSGQETDAVPTLYPDAQAALAATTAVSSGVTAMVPVKFFNQDWGELLKLPASGRSPLSRAPDEKLGELDCFVISAMIDVASSTNQNNLPPNWGSLGMVTTTLWIGKTDHLIHQTRQVMPVPAKAPITIVMTQSHENIVVNQKFTPADFAR